MRSGQVSFLVLLALSPACTSTPAGIRWTDDPSAAHDFEVAWDEYRPADGRGPVVHLVSMVHVAEPGFFRSVQGRLDDADVVLMEGIGTASADTPTPKSAPGVNDSLRQIADLAGLVMQWDALRPRASWVAADLHQATLGPSVARTESDLRDVSEGLRRHAALAERLLARARPWMDAETRRRRVGIAVIRRSVARALAKATVDTPERRSLIDRRNARALELFDAAVPELGPDRSVAFCWGVRHLPGLAVGLHARGYRRAERRWRPVFRVGTL